MLRKLFYLWPLLFFALPVAAEEIYLGKVAIVDPSITLRITIDPADRVNLRAGEKVVFKTQIPGLDEMAVSSVGQVWNRKDGKIGVRGEGGEGMPQIGDKAFYIEVPITALNVKGGQTLQLMNITKTSKATGMA